MSVIFLVVFSMTLGYCFNFVMIYETLDYMVKKLRTELSKILKNYLTKPLSFFLNFCFYQASCVYVHIVK